MGKHGYYKSVVPCVTACTKGPGTGAGKGERLAGAVGARDSRAAPASDEVPVEVVTMIILP